MTDTELHDAIRAECQADTETLIQAHLFTAARDQDVAGLVTFA